ncbi:MAG: hypothetical protein ACI4U0_07005 [Candidatus Aphodocola sp.]
MKENGFEYVDLGLPSGTMWATCNVGATKPEDFGLLFQFGCVNGYKYGDKDNRFKTDDLTTASGKVYKKNDILDLADDAAHVNMGGKWKMPTNDQLKELLDNTTHNVVTINRVKGMMFTSNINGQFMFIPFAGYWDNGSFGYAWSNANLLSSQVTTYNRHLSYRIYCCYSDIAYILECYRFCAFSVRGVFNK